MSDDNDFLLTYPSSSKAGHVGNIFSVLLLTISMVCILNTFWNFGLMHAVDKHFIRRDVELAAEQLKDVPGVSEAFASVPTAAPDEAIRQSNFAIRTYTLTGVWLLFFFTLGVFLVGINVGYVSTYDLLQNTAISFAFFLMTELFFFTIIHLNYKFVSREEITAKLIQALL